MMDERTLALHAAQALYDKKAVDLMVLDGHLHGTHGAAGALPVR